MIQAPKTLLQRLPPDVASALQKAPKVWLISDPGELSALSVNGAVEGVKTVRFDVPGRGPVAEATVALAKNGVIVNYPEPYMRRRDPDSMLIGDEFPTDKPKFSDVIGRPFSGLRKETFEWLSTQELVLVPFLSGQHPDYPSLAIVPMEAAFFAHGIKLLQGLIPAAELPADFAPKVLIYVAPHFRHTVFGGKQMVVHERTDKTYEIFSYNLYPGPSAKKGVYGALLHYGEKEGWVTAHCSAVKVTTPYDKHLVIMHEGASGSGKSEMLESLHREADGMLHFGENTVTGEGRKLSLPRGCLLEPAIDDMGLCHPSLQGRDGRITVNDAEGGWFIRVNHITRYGTDPDIENLSIHPSEPVLFMNIDAPPGSTALVWEHIMDAPGKPCPNPRVIFPRKMVPRVLHKPVTVDVRSFGVRTPPCTRELPTYGILGLFHILPPALAWIWRLTALRGHGNPSIISKSDMESEGVGTFWPFATGKRIRWANLLLEQIEKSPNTVYVLVPNQHVGAWHTRFMPQWIMREFLARRGGAWFRSEQVHASRCPLLGYSPVKVMIEGQTFESQFLEVHRQAEVGEEAYDKGARILQDFFHQELKTYLGPDLSPKGRAIIEACLSNGDISVYQKLLGDGLLHED